MSHNAPTPEWTRRGRYDQRTGTGEWWTAAPGWELHKRGGIWMAFLFGEVVARDSYLSNLMLRLERYNAETGEKTEE